MLTNVPEGGIWLATAPADMRKSFDGLAALVRNELGGDVVSGGWFVFVNRRRTMMKIIGFGPGGCWAHARREFEKAKDSEPRLAAEALELIGALQLCEREIRKRKLEGAGKLEFRRTRSRPVANAFWKWCDRRYEDPRHLPKSPIAEAPDYARNRRSELEAWLSDPEVPIDTNHLERGLRVLPLGRKNWLFCWTEVGAEAVGIAQSPVATCQLQGVGPRAYLEDVLQRVSVHPSSRVGELTPRRWKDLFAGDPLKSDLGTGVECRASDLPGKG